jgi:hypothetical protein
MMIEGLMRRWALAITTAITLTTGVTHGAAWNADHRSSGARGPCARKIRDFGRTMEEQQEWMDVLLGKRALPSCMGDTIKPPEVDPGAVRRTDNAAIS